MSRFDAPIEKNFSFVNTSEPTDAEEGQTWYDPGDDVARVYNGNSWEQMNITQHGALSGVTEGQHRSDQRVADLAPVQSVEGATGAVTLGPGDVGALPDSYSAPVQTVNGQTGDVSVDTAATPPITQDGYTESYGVNNYSLPVSGTIPAGKSAFRIDVSIADDYNASDYTLTVNRPDGTEFRSKTVTTGGTGTGDTVVSIRAGFGIHVTEWQVDNADGFTPALDISADTVQIP